MAQSDQLPSLHDAVVSASAPSKQILPRFQLLCMEKKFSDAFNDAVQIHYPTLSEQTTVTIHNCALEFFPADQRIDAVVSPANSYGRMDGAFDDALARAYQPAGQDYYWLTRVVQRVVYDKWRGFAPPGTCTVVPLDQGYENEQPWGTKYLMLCPTMRVPEDVRWDGQVVYECIWSLLCAIDAHNRACEAGGLGVPIQNVLMTPLATGVGLVSARKWAEQCVIALRHFAEARENPQVWGNLRWGKIFEDTSEVAATYDGKKSGILSLG